jgi:hypothetical protein
MTTSRRETASTVDLDALAERLVPLVVARIAAAMTPKADYSTRKGCGPVGIGDRAWKRQAEDMLAAHVVGVVRRGRWIVVPRSSLEASEAPAARASEPRAREPWSPGAALRDAGLRATR